MFFLEKNTSTNFYSTPNPSFEQILVLIPARAWVRERLRYEA
jgi:hypothetical protein